MARLGRAELETAVALCRAAGNSHDALLQAQSRIWAAETALGVPSRMLKLFAASDALEPSVLNELMEKADLPGAVALQAGTLADMDLVARTITGD